MKKKSFPKTVFLLGCFLCALFLFACRPKIETGNIEPPRQPATTAPAAAQGNQAQIGFRSQRQYDEHFEKHGREFGAISQAEYLRLAQTLRDAPVGGDILEAARPDGTVSRFDRGSGAFLAFNRDLTIRTFFRPNDGERYFKRQINRNR